MESFSLLKYWRGGGGPTPAALPDFPFNSNSSAATLVTALPHNQAETDEEENDNDDGPFFDLEFAVPDEDETRKHGTNSIDGTEEEDEDEEDGDSDGEREFNFTLSSGSSNEHSDANLTFSPSDDLFFKGKLVPVEASSNGGSEPNIRPQLRVTLLKSAAKFRVFMSGLKKSKSNGEKKTETDGSVGETIKSETKEETTENPSEKNENQPEKDQNQTKNKFFAVKFKVEEVPIMSLFTRDNSSRGSGGATINKLQKQSSDESTSEENRFSKEVIMQKYLKMVKPLYIRVSRRYGEKFRLSGQLILGAAGAKSGAPPSIAAPPKSPSVEKPVTETEVVEVKAPTTTNFKGRNMPAKLRVVCKHLGKSRSASSAVAAAPPGVAPSRRDDSLLQQQDGIQSAILHCKRSFNASRDSESSLLSRSVSDTLRDKPSDLTEKAIG
ncbi:probable membrane-associated kinase regulator 2 [Benincasa hispida]|uniref:probable membrane-associated kinase regulator 2 n=1 Tax=Benincasa hispida TaxID=102211 RepID=UPI001901EC4A|nr:probable membrane-associated kinase regulator 2 [Benincasa hispida]